jgi:hypothetical protein
MRSASGEQLGRKGPGMILALETIFGIFSISCSIVPLSLPGAGPPKRSVTELYMLTLKLSRAVEAI